MIQLLQEKAREQERELEELRYTVTQCVKLERQAQQAMEHANTTTLDSKVHVPTLVLLPTSLSHCVSLTGVQRA